MAFHLRQNSDNLITADHEVLNVARGSKSEQKNALVVQDDFGMWMQGYPINTKTHRKQCRVYKDIFRRHKSKKEFTQTNSKEVIKACPVLQWKLDTSTPRRSETNGVAEGAVGRVKEATAIASGSKQSYR